ncbi:MAG TPA: hypothetical protein VMB52_06360 [Verrucomicrobiae bacterium]|nr:hypothetical protein [Verrucomicrobiae bacterium]
MMIGLRGVDKFHRTTRAGHLLFGLIELLVAFLFARWAVPSGDWWEWLLALMFLVGSLQNLVRMVLGSKT